MPPKRSTRKRKTKETPDTPEESLVKKSRALAISKPKSKKQNVKDSAQTDDSSETQNVKTTKFLGNVPVNFGENNDKWLGCTGNKTIDNFRVVDVTEVSQFQGRKGSFHAMLNQTNISNNNNKYFLIQLLQNNATGKYHAFFRWGRVGKIAGMTLNPGTDLDSALSLFYKKFSDKTKNEFDELVESDFQNFEKVNGKYDFVFIDYGENKENESPKKEVSKKSTKPKSQKEPESKLKLPIQTLIKMICDLKRMEAQVKELSFDTNRSPLGKITKDQISKGY